MNEEGVPMNERDAQAAGWPGELRGRRLQRGQTGEEVRGGCHERLDSAGPPLTPTPRLMCPSLKWTHYGLCKQ